MGTATVLRLVLFLACSFFCQLYAANEFITKLVLYDTSVNPGGNLGPIVSGMIIDLATTGTKLTIVAQINSTIDGYVYFKFDDAFKNQENSQFYALNGNSGSYLNAFAPLTLIGEHTLVADFTTFRLTNCSTPLLQLSLLLTLEPTKAVDHWRALPF